MQPKKNTNILSLRAQRGNLLCCAPKQQDCRAIARNDGTLIKRQQGVSIVAAIFLITALALLATAAVQLVSTGQQSISQEITSVKAYFAGQTGLQWGMYQTVYATPSTPQIITLSNSGLSNTTVDLTFTVSTIDGNTYYQISSTGKYSTTSSPEYSSRKLSMRFKP